MIFADGYWFLMEFSVECLIEFGILSCNRGLAKITFISVVLKQMAVFSVGLHQMRELLSDSTNKQFAQFLFNIWQTK